MSGWLNLCNTVPDSSRPGNRPILKFTKYVYQVLTYYKAGRNLSETRLSSDVCRVDFIFKFQLMAFFSHDLGQLSHPFPLSLLATFIASLILTNIQWQQAASYICLCGSTLQNCCLYNVHHFFPPHSVSLALCEVFWFLSRRFTLYLGCFLWWLVCFFSDILLQRLCCRMVRAPFNLTNSDLSAPIGPFLMWVSTRKV